MVRLMGLLSNTMKKFKRKIVLFFVPVLGYIIMRMLWLTTKKKFVYTSGLDLKQYIYVCWHGELLMSPQAYRHIHKKQKASAMISHHFDGELIAKIYKYLHIDAIRGSGRRGAKEVFFKAFRVLKSGEELLLTPDGPKGPRHFVHDGAIALSLKQKVPLCVIGFTCSNYWQLNSWDKFVIPKPFSHIDFYIKPLNIEGMKLEDAKRYLRAEMLEHTIA